MNFLKTLNNIYLYIIMVSVKVEYKPHDYELKELSQIVDLLETEGTSTNSPDKINPYIVWEPIQYVQKNYTITENDGILNAVAYTSSVKDVECPGEFIYDPSNGYVLSEVGTITLKAYFKPNDLENYNIVQASTTINVV